MVIIKWVSFREPTLRSANNVGKSTLLLSLPFASLSYVAYFLAFTAFPAYFSFVVRITCVKIVRMRFITLQAWTLRHSTRQQSVHWKDRSALQATFCHQGLATWLLTGLAARHRLQLINAKKLFCGKKTCATKEIILLTKRAPQYFDNRWNRFLFLFVWCKQQFTTACFSVSVRSLNLLCPWAQRPHLTQ